MLQPAREIVLVRRAVGYCQDDGPCCSTTNSLRSAGHQDCSTRRFSSVAWRTAGSGDLPSNVTNLPPLRTARPSRYTSAICRGPWIRVASNAAESSRLGASGQNSWTPCAHASDAIASRIRCQRRLDAEGAPSVVALWVRPSDSIRAPSWDMRESCARYPCSGSCLGCSVDRYFLWKLY